MTDLSHGHRVRLRQRFLSAGGAGLSDYEMLELVLFRAIPRRDVKPLAKQLIARFGDFNAVVSAEIPRLQETPGLGFSAIVELKIVEAAAQRLTRIKMMRRPALSSWQALLEYCTITMAHQSIEHFRVLFLDRKNTLIADEQSQHGTIDQVPVYPREVIKRALALNASALILVHNHPSGDPKPSQADIEMTRKIVEIARVVGVRVHDHLIIGRHGHASLKNLGLM